MTNKYILNGVEFVYNPDKSDETNANYFDDENNCLERGVLIKLGAKPVEDEWEEIEEMDDNYYETVWQTVCSEQQEAINKLIRNQRKIIKRLEER